MRTERTLGVLLLGALAIAGCGAAGYAPAMQDMPAAQAAPAERKAAGPSDAFDRALELAALGRWEEAAARFRALGPAFQSAGRPDRAAEAAFWLGFCLEKQGRTAAAREQYDRVLSERPTSPASRQARHRRDALGP